ncbi:MAG: class II aldolase/adducin family protein [Dehalococcoidia bacterium]
MGEAENLEKDLRMGTAILEWELGDIIGHVGVRLPDNEGIAVKLLRVDQEDKYQDWMTRFDFDGNKLSGTGTVPGEAVIYTKLFAARPEVNAIVHAHAPMCVVMGLAGIPISGVHLQSAKFGTGMPVYPLPMYVSNEHDGDEVVKTIGDGPAMTINGHGIVVAGKSIDEAVITALYMERAAKVQYAARNLGFTGVSEEFENVLAGNREKIMERGANIDRPKTGHSDEWRYYSRKIEQGETWSRSWT